MLHGPVPRVDRNRGGCGRHKTTKRGCGSGRNREHGRGVRGKLLAGPRTKRSEGQVVGRAKLLAGPSCWQGQGVRGKTLLLCRRAKLLAGARSKGEDTVAVQAMGEAIRKCAGWAKTVAT
jgi:hypothetical protein